MNEKSSKEKIQSALEAAEADMTSNFRTLVATYGPVDPATLPQNDEVVRTTFDAYYEWIDLQTKKATEASDTREAHLQMSLKVTPFLVDAGFTDEAYVADVAEDWMSQDLADAEEGGYNELAEAFREKIAALRVLYLEHS